MEKSNQIAKTGEGLVDILRSHAKELAAIAPNYVNVNRLMALAIEAKQRNPLLAQCSPVSILNFCKKCAETGTDRIGAGGMWAVPFFNSKTGSYDMAPIPDWRLLIEQAKRAKAIKHAMVDAVYANDVFEYERGLEPKLMHKPARENRGELQAVYCIYVLPDGTKDFVVMSWNDDIVPIRDRTNAWKSYLKTKHENPWVTDPAEQAKKTCVKRALKIFQGASPELTKLIDADNVVNGFPEIEIEAAPMIGLRNDKNKPEPAKHEQYLAKAPENASNAGTSTAENVTSSPKGQVDAKQPEASVAKKGTVQPGENASLESIKFEINAMIMDMAPGSLSDQENSLEIFSGFINKDGRTIKGVRSTIDPKFTESWARNVHRKIKEAHDKWTENQNAVDASWEEGKAE